MADGKRMAVTSQNSDRLQATPFKVVMLGDASVGKTCLVNRFVKNTYQIYEATMAQDFQSKTVKISLKNPVVSAVRLHIWDTAGGEQFRSLTHIYYKGANVICLVYDSTSQKSFEALNFWVEEIKQRVDMEMV